MAETEKAKRIREALEATKDKHGRITAKGVVEAAKDKKNPLHGQFGKLWNAKIAQQWALEQRANELIRTYLTVTVISEDKKVTAVMYVQDPRIPNNQQGHIALTSKEFEQRDAENIMLRELDRCTYSIQRARDVCGVLDTRFPGMSARLERMLAEIVDCRSRLRPAA